jgi:hypothetical protein
MSGIPYLLLLFGLFSLRALARANELTHVLVPFFLPQILYLYPHGLTGMTLGRATKDMYFDGGAPVAPL